MDDAIDPEHHKDCYMRKDAIDFLKRVSGKFFINATTYLPSIEGHAGYYYSNHIKVSRQAAIRYVEGLMTEKLAAKAMIRISVSKSEIASLSDLVFIGSTY